MAHSCFLALQLCCVTLFDDSRTEGLLTGLLLCQQPPLALEFHARDQACRCIIARDSCLSVGSAYAWLSLTSHLILMLYSTARDWDAHAGHRHRVNSNSHSQLDNAGHDRS